MKNCKMGFLILFCLGLSFSVNAQQSQVYVDWKALPEDSNHVDVAYRIVQCTPTSNDEIHLNVFNENDALSSISFTLTISDTVANLSTTHLVSNYAIPFAAMHIAGCGNSQYASLKIAMPAGYDPNSTQVLIAFQ